MGGIGGTKAEGADSIVVNGGYEDDEDYGDEIIYTGPAATNRRPQSRSRSSASTAAGRNNVEMAPRGLTAAGLRD